MKENRPGIVAYYTNDVVYSRLAPGVLEELRTRNPLKETGGRASKHHQWLTEEIGHPGLSNHLHAVITLMKISDSWTPNSIGRLRKHSLSSATTSKWIWGMTIKIAECLRAQPRRRLRATFPDMQTHSGDTLSLSEVEFCAFLTERPISPLSAQGEFPEEVPVGFPV